MSPVVSRTQVPHIIMPIHLVSYAYSFGVLCLQLFHIIMPIQVPPSVPHIRASHIIMLIHSVPHISDCLTHPSVPYNHAYSFWCLMSPVASRTQVPHIIMPIHLVSRIPVVSHNRAYSFGVSCLQLSHIIMPIHLVSHVSSCLT